MDVYCTTEHCPCIGIKQFSAGKAIRCTAESCKNKSEPSCGSCKWYLERNALIERIKKAYCDGCENYNGVRCRACGIGDAIDVVEDAPTALERTAEWIVQDDTFTRFECSRCHTKNHHTRWDYCPSCGAKMENAHG